MSLGGNYFLLDNNFVADRAVFALGLSGFFAGRRNRRIDNLRMPLGGNFFHPGKYCITIQALCTRLVTGLGAGCSLFFDFNGIQMPCRTYCLGLCFTAIHTSVLHYAFIFARRCCYNNTDFRPLVSLCGNCFLLNKNFIADRAVLALGLSGFFAGRRDGRIDNLCMSLGGNNFLLDNNFVADRAVLALGQSCFLAGCRNSSIDNLGMSLSGNDLAGSYYLTAILAVGVAGIAGHGAGCFLGITKFCVLMCARRAAPDAADIVDGIAGLGGLRFGVGAVGVVKPCGGDRNLVGFHAGLLRILICFCFRAGCTLLDILTGSLGGANVRTACGGINAADSGQRTVDIHLCIGKRRTLACPTGCVNHRNILCVTGAAVAAPLVHIIDIDALSAGHH